MHRLDYLIRLYSSLKNVWTVLLLGGVIYFDIIVDGWQCLMLRLIAVSTVRTYGLHQISWRQTAKILKHNFLLLPLH